MKRSFLRAAAGVVLLASPVWAQYTFQAEPNHSTVSFAVPIAGGMTKVRGSFTKFTAEMIHDESDISKWSVNAVIEVASINTGIADRDRDLQSQAFFDAANHPQITFHSRRIEQHGERYVAHGDLTIRGVTKPYALEFVFTGWNRDKDKPDVKPRFGIAAKGKLNRLDFGVATDWKHTLIPNFIGEEIEIEIDMWTRGGTKVAGSSTPQ